MFSAILTRLRYCTVVHYCITLLYITLTYITLQEGKYFVKWVGSRHNSWEPLANLDCTDILVDFYNTRVGTSHWLNILNILSFTVEGEGGADSFREGSS